MLFRRFLLVSASLLCLAALPAKAEGFSDAQKTEIQGIIKSYLSENPQVIMDSMQAYQQKQAADRMAGAQTALENVYGDLTAKDLPSTGNPDGDVTVVEFYDYNCGYCKKAFADVTTVLESDKNVRFVFHEMAILGPSSEVAARWSLASHKQGKFFAFHSALMNHQGGLDDATLEQTAKSVGLDIEQLKKDAESEEVKATIAKHREMALSLNIQGTPGFVIGKKLYPGYLGPDGMKNAIKEAREAKK